MMYHRMKRMPTTRWKTLSLVDRLGVQPTTTQLLIIEETTNIEKSNHSALQAFGFHSKNQLENTRVIPTHSGGSRRAA